MVSDALADAVLVIKRGGIKMGMKENAFAFIDAHRSEIAARTINPVLIRLLRKWRTC